VTTRGRAVATERSSLVTDLAHDGEAREPQDGPQSGPRILLTCVLLLGVPALVMVIVKVLFGL
jgi:hypothetical protein